MHVIYDLICLCFSGTHRFTQPSGSEIFWRDSRSIFRL